MASDIQGTALTATALANMVEFVGGDGSDYIGGDYIGADEDVFAGDAESSGQQRVTEMTMRAAVNVTAKTGTPASRLQGKAIEVVPWRYDHKGRELITPKDIERIIQLFGDKIDKWVYVLHDRDEYTWEDERRNPLHKAGTRKPEHYHIMLLLRVRQRLYQVASWFAVGPEQVERKGGKLDGPFIDMVEYYTHRQFPMKAQYDESELVSNVDVHELLEEVAKRRSLTAKYAKTTEEIQLFCDRIADGKMTLDEVWDKVGGYTFSKNERAFRTARAHFLEKVALLPKYRGNYYISGDSGEGKGVLAFDLACSLAGVPDDVMQDVRGAEDSKAVDLSTYVFAVSPDERGSISFNGYDGQSVIIWEDVTGGDVCRVLGGVKSTLQALEVHPRFRVDVNVKYGHATLINAVNIFCGTERYDDFLKGLVGWQRDGNGAWKSNGQPLKQTYRRVPVVVNVHASDFDILLRNDLTMTDGDVMRYDVYKNVRGSFAALAGRLAGACKGKYMGRMLPPVLDAVDTARAASVEGKITDADEVIPEFEDFGRVTTVDDIVAAPEQYAVDDGRLVREHDTAMIEADTPPGTAIMFNCNAERWSATCIKFISAGICTPDCAQRCTNDFVETKGGAENGKVGG